MYDGVNSNAMWQKDEFIRKVSLHRRDHVGVYMATCYGAQHEQSMVPKGCNASYISSRLTPVTALDIID